LTTDSKRAALCREIAGSPVFASVRVQAVAICVEPPILTCINNYYHLGGSCTYIDRPLQMIERDPPGRIRGKFHV